MNKKKSLSKIFMATMFAFIMMLVGVIFVMPQSKTDAYAEGYEWKWYTGLAGVDEQTTSEFPILYVEDYDSYPYTVTVRCGDSDDAFTYSFENLPTGFTIDDSTECINTDNQTQVITCSDTSSLVLNTYTITVTATDNTNPNSPIVETKNYTLKIASNKWTVDSKNANGAINVVAGKTYDTMESISVLFSYSIYPYSPSYSKSSGWPDGYDVSSYGGGVVLVGTSNVVKQYTIQVNAYYVDLDCEEFTVTSPKFILNVLGVVSYDANAGSDTVTNMPTGANYSNGETVTVDTTTVPVRSGYAFLGWNTNKDATSAENFTNNQFTMGTNSVTLYAI